MSGWESVLLALGGHAVLLIVLAFLARSLITNWLAKDLDRHKEALRHESEQSLETLRHQLALVAQEHALKASELQARRAEVIASIYSQLADVEWESSVYVNLADLTGKNKNEAQHALVSEKVEQFYRYFNRHRIYLPEDTCEVVWGVMNGMVKATNRMKSYLYDSPREDQRISKEQLNALMAAHDHFSKHHGDARKKLERDLRLMMGDKQSQ